MRVNIGDQKEWVEKGLEKLRYEYDLSKDDLVIDVGSYMGEFGQKIRDKYKCRVREYDLLNNRGLWIKEGYLETGGAFYYTSIYEPSNKKYYALDAVKELKGLDIALIKINIEGAEYELLEYLIDNRVHTDFKNIQVQFHTIDGIDTDKKYKMISKKLNKTHNLEWRFPYVWESWKIKTP